MRCGPAARLLLPGALAAQFDAEARGAFPNECCGLIEGARDGDAVEAIALHPTRNLAREANRFEIDPAEHIRLARALRGTGRDIVGCYHSHPNGDARPSARDLEAAREENFVWLIAAVAKDTAPIVAAHLYADGAFRALALA